MNTETGSKTYTQNERKQTFQSKTRGNWGTLTQTFIPIQHKNNLKDTYWKRPQEDLLHLNIEMTHGGTERERTTNTTNINNN